jgi:transcriptional regulator
VYIPRHFTVDDPAEVDSFLAAHPAGQLITVGPDGAPDATLVPYVRDGSGDGERILVHLARANEHWRRIADGGAALLVVSGADAYVSPGWYTTKREHGRVVPTWNYSAVHLGGTVRVHHDPDWLLDVVTRLTDRHERSRAEPWAVTDAPEAYVRGQLKAIVGVEILVERVEAKAKLSQNRSLDDRLGTIAGLEGETTSGARDVAAAMRSRLPGAG